MTTVEYQCCDFCNASMDVNQETGVIKCSLEKATTDYKWAQSDTGIMCYRCRMKLDSTPVKETPNDGSV